MYKSTLLGLLASSSVSAQLHSLALDAGLLYFGTTVDNGYTSDEAYMAIVNDVDEFGQLVPENGQKWDSTEPTQDTFSYTTADVIPDLAAKNGQILRCHALTWYSQLPSWVSSGGFTAEQLQSVIEAHISNVVGHFKGDCYAWDVVNEAAADDGTWRSSVFYDTMGTDFLAVSFNAAHEADPNAKLYYNDYNLEYNGAKTDRAVEIVQIIQDAGAPIDGVGFQGHLIVGSTPSRSSLVTALERFTALGVEVAYTELDIRHASIPASDAAKATQADDYTNVVGSCLDVEGCVGVTVWGFTDRYNWVPETFSGAGEACIYDEDLNKKPAWTSISSLLAAAATASSAQETATSASVAETTVVATTAEPTTIATEEAVSSAVSSVVSSSAAIETTVPVATSESVPAASAISTVEEVAVSSSTVLESTTAPVTTTAFTPAGPVFTPIYTPRVNRSTISTTSEASPSTSVTGGYNFTVPFTTFQTRTTTAAPISISSSSEAAAEYPTLSLPSNQTLITTIIEVPVSTRVPIIRHSTTAYSVAPWSNGTMTTIVTSVPAGTAPLPIATETAVDEDDDECDDDVEDEDYEDDEDCEEELVAHYYQCGGRNWEGATECEEPYVCLEMNEYYSQCVESS
ncbi:glycoside hydrolase superfamily [Dactylonectria estremocensis]|uniref:Beta-xylanase n=1 Tax=Dactylonectria estremocensis TaxID=1079267 RepID=A0A9P9J417_9HYPO|nr:glycoside hydrolase superfamily [Dactylonectria estremocensis]